MNKSIFTYLRTSALLRLFSTVAFIALSASSISAGECAGCSTSTKADIKTNSCAIPQDTEEATTKGTSCCCSKPAPKNIEPKAKAPKVIASKAKAPMSCCSIEIEEDIESTEENTKENLVNSTNATCKNFGSCRTKMQTDTKAPTPPQLRTVELERENALSSMIQTPCDPTSLVRITGAKYATTIVLSNGPPASVGIGSSLLLC